MPTLLQSSDPKTEITGSAATVERANSTAVDGSYSAEISVTSAATHTSANSPCLECAVQFWQVGPALQKGNVYLLQFWAKADAARTMRIGLGSSGPPFQNYGLPTSVAIDGDWRRYVLYFQATATDQNARLTLYYGEQAGNTWLNAVVLLATSQ